MNQIYNTINPYIITIDCDCIIRRNKRIADAKKSYIEKLQKELRECEHKYSWILDWYNDIDHIKLRVKMLEIKKEMENPHLSNYNPIDSTSDWECSCDKY